MIILFDCHDRNKIVHKFLIEFFFSVIIIFVRTGFHKVKKCKYILNKNFCMQFCGKKWNEHACFENYHMMNKLCVQWITEWINYAYKGSCDE